MDLSGTNIQPFIAPGPTMITLNGWTLRAEDERLIAVSPDGRKTTLAVSRALSALLSEKD
jgi:hypothetical protein